jgi:hypothetical protein
MQSHLYRSNDPSTSAAKPLPPSLSQALPGFIDAMVTEEAWRGRTKAQSETTFRLFTDWCRDKPLRGHTRKGMAGFFDLLSELPARDSKDKRRRALPLIGISQGRWKPELSA